MPPATELHRRQASAPAHYSSVDTCVLRLARLLAPPPRPRGAALGTLGRPRFWRSTQMNARAHPRHASTLRFARPTAGLLKSCIRVHCARPSWADSEVRPSVHAARPDQSAACRVTVLVSASSRRHTLASSRQSHPATHGTAHGAEAMRACYRTDP